MCTRTTSGLSSPQTSWHHCSEYATDTHVQTNNWWVPGNTSAPREDRCWVEVRKVVGSKVGEAWAVGWEGEVLRDVGSLVGVLRGAGLRVGATWAAESLVGVPMAVGSRAGFSMVHQPPASIFMQVPQHK